MISSSSCFAYIVCPTNCLEKEFSTFADAFESTQRILSEDLRVDGKSRACAVISARQLGEKEQAMLVLAIL
jgi:hypothetical protein